MFRPSALEHEKALRLARKASHPVGHGQRETDLGLGEQFGPDLLDAFGEQRRLGRAVLLERRSIARRDLAGCFSERVVLRWVPCTRQAASRLA